jgi:catechol 2,3-dioxygenase-like lactoylglutathione lyase family enzyme
MNIKETNVTLMVKDVDKAVSFYEAIGLTVKNRWGNHYVQMVTKDLILGIHPSDEESQGSGNLSIGFVIDSIAEAKALLDKHNIAYESSEDKAGSFINCKDPDGTIVYYMQPKQMW